MADQPLRPRRFARRDFLQVPFDMITVEEVLSTLQLRKAEDPFAYVVTPNVDHVVRLAKRPVLLPAYRAAWMSWCDSHPLRLLARLLGLPMPHLNGTDMTVRIFSEVLRPGDRLVCITADDALLSELAARFPQYQFVGCSPPPGFEDEPRMLAACVDFILDHPARFVFIGVGSPRSERLAHAVLRTGRATGTAFCIGAALEFIVGRKARAPRAMQAMGLEWLHRLASEPRRLWRRYAFAAAPLCVLFTREWMARRKV
jgi:N-acetylglucosaminyldiphosphoundecaprenol N-acetyl-beta-D-mannosaminyltransferase